MKKAFLIVTFLFIGTVEKAYAEEPLCNITQGTTIPRPNFENSIVSAHFIVHYTTTGEHATTQQYAQSVSNYAEYSYTVQCTQIKHANEIKI